MAYLSTKSGSIEETVKNLSKHMEDSAYQTMFKKELDKAANIMSMKSSGGYNNVKKNVMKVQKALNTFLYTLIFYTSAINFFSEFQRYISKIFELCKTQSNTIAKQ